MFVPTTKFWQMNILLLGFINISIYIVLAEDVNGTESIVFSEFCLQISHASRFFLKDV